MATAPAIDLDLDQIRAAAPQRATGRTAPLHRARQGLLCSGGSRYSACRAVVVLAVAAQVAGPSAPMMAMTSPVRASRVRPPTV
jgi:hypothetical protein